MHKLLATVFLAALALAPLNSHAVEEGWGVEAQAPADPDSAPEVNSTEDPNAWPTSPEEQDPADNPQEPEAADTEAETPPEPNADGTTPPVTATTPPPAPELDPSAPEGEVVEEEAKWHPMKSAVLQGLNKVTAKTSVIKTDVGAKTKFGNLELVVEKCNRGPEDEKAENTALITIWDEIPGQQRSQVFRGWMFSSSPAISALEHPIYDVILLSCGTKPEATPEAKADDAAPKKKDAPKK